ncbi:hypothetical protein NPIL_651741, partial [Nephila pilipes]
IGEQHFHIEMVLFFVVAVLLGVFLILIRYSLWREKYCQNLPGIKPGFFNVLGDFTNILMRAISSDDHSILHQNFKRSVAYTSYLNIVVNVNVCLRAELLILGVAVPNVVTKLNVGVDEDLI